MDWDDVRYFLALSRVGSVRTAGISLGVSHSTVARRVEALEIQLATRLFDRSRDGYTLTAAGLQMLPSAERVEAQMSALELELAGQDERLAGPVRLTCCDHYVSEMMLQATRAGLGIAMLPCYVADRDSALRRLAKPDLKHVANLWLVSHPDLRDNARFRATRDSVAQALSRRRSLFQGDCPAGRPGEQKAPTRS